MFVGDCWVGLVVCCVCLLLFMVGLLFGVYGCLGFVVC